MSYLESIQDEYLTFKKNILAKEKEDIFNLAYKIEAYNLFMDYISMTNRCIDITLEELYYEYLDANFDVKSIEDVDILVDNILKYQEEQLKSY